MSERKIRELNYKFQVVNVKLMSAERSGDALSCVNKVW